MNVRVKLFAGAKQAVGSNEVELILADDATLADLRKELVHQFPSLAEIVRRAMFSVNLDYANDSTRLSPTAEIACIPPVSGG